MPGLLNLDWFATADESSPTTPSSGPGIYRGDTYTLVYKAWQDSAKTIPINLSGSTFTAQLRAVRMDYDDPYVAPLASFTVNTASASTGQLTLTISSADTTVLPSKCVWDLQQTTGSSITTLLNGKVKVKDDVTRVAP